MAPEWLFQKNFKLLKHTHFICSFEARDLEISNILNYFCGISKFRDFYEHFNKFREIRFAHIFAKQLY